MSNVATPKLFTPVKVGAITLQHRIVMSPMTRFRATTYAHVPLPHVKDYYSQRGSTPGTLLITEGVIVTGKAGGSTSVPGIWSDEQVAAWKEVTAAVHAKGSFIFCQLWALGRTAATADLKAEDPSFEAVAPSPIKLADYEDTPRALTKEEIKEYVSWFGEAAKKAVNEAGFDGVEIHGANGYLLDEFLQDVSNTRTDEFGGSVENRARFPLQVVDEVVRAVGADRVGYRISPWSTYQDMRMKDPIPQFSYFASELKARQPDLAYLHVVEPILAPAETGTVQGLPQEEQNDFIREIWAPKTYISAGGYTRELAIKDAEEKGGLIASGRHFLANPDLPVRWEHNYPLTPYDRDTFYTKGDTSPRGFTDYPFYKEAP